MSFQDKIKKITQEKDAGDFKLEQQEKEADSEELEQFTPSPFFGYENVKNSTACLEFRLANGVSKGLPYSYLLEINYHASEGIEVIFTTKKAIITGRNLRQLYLFLLAFRVKYIKANVGNDITEESAMFVKDIKIEDIT